MGSRRTPRSRVEQAIDEALKRKSPGLNLSNQGLREAPKSLKALTQFQYLSLRGNQLTALPEGLGSLSQLQSLYLRGNQLTALPEGLGSLSQLQSLYLRGSQLTALPEWLGSLNQLQSLDLSGNPVAPDLAEASQQGSYRLLAYFRERSKDATRLWQAKVMLVGEGGHGKTCLLRALRGEVFIPGHVATPLLDVKELRLPHPHEKAELDLRVWDFGGQDYYFATQQLFFTGKSIFLLVWNPRGNFEQGTMMNWLDRIHALAPDSPVFLVATHGDRHKPNVPLAQLRAKYSSVHEEVFSVDNSSGLNIDALRCALQYAAADLDHMGVKGPASWVKAIEAIHSQEESYLAVDRFREFATQQGVTEFDAFSAQLNLSGEITFFSRNPIYHPETAELNDWVILKPAWLLQRISAVLTDEAARKSSAFVKKDLVRIWPDDPKFIRDFLARVMEHFDLAYHVDDQDGRHIVVELAPEDRPAAVAPRWDEWLANASFEKIALHYKFPIAIPPGLPTWFTARAHSYTTPERHWRRGAFLTDSKGNAALIEAELNNRMVKLEVPGPVPLEFFTKLRICFEETVNRFPGLQQTVKEHVPCVKPTCPGFDRQTLELEYKEGERHIRCQASDCRAKHEIAALLYGLSRSREEQTVAAILDELGKLQQEFNMLTAREQSRYDSRCPSLFTLEFERLAKLLPSVVEDMWEHLTDKPTSAQLTIWCQHPGECHAVKTYLIEPPGRRLAELVPLMKKAHAIIGAAAPIISAMYPLVKAPNFKDLADTWTDKVSGPLQLLRESVGDPERAYGVALVALRQILTEVAAHEIDRWGGLRQVLLLKSQYLWVCEEHARHPDYRG